MLPFLVNTTPSDRTTLCVRAGMWASARVCAHPRHVWVRAWVDVCVRDQCGTQGLRMVARALGAQGET